MKQEILEKRTRSSKTHDLGNGHYTWDGTIGSIHYDDNGEWKEIDNIFEPALAPWDWEMLNAGYHIRVKEDFTAGQIIEFEKQDETVQFQPMALEWTNDLDQIQLVSIPQEVTPVITNPEVDLLPAVGMPSHQGTIRWDDGYGDGLDFEWRCTSTRLVKILEVESLNKLPIPEQYIIDGGNPVLRLNLIFDPSKDTDIYIDGAKWNKSTKKQTFNIIEFRKDGEALWGFMPLRYWGSGDENEGQSVATLEKRGNKLYISIRVPYEWLQTAVYPVFIDTDVDETVGASSDDSYQDAYHNNYPTANVMYLDSGSQWMGFRWTGVNLPSGANVSVAYFEPFTHDEDDDDIKADIYCQDANNPGTFTDTDDDIADRARTSAKANWDEASLGEKVFVESPSIVLPVQEVIDDQGGTGDALVVILDGLADTNLEIESYDYYIPRYAKLHIEYSAAGPAHIPRHSGSVGVLIF